MTTLKELAEMLDAATGPSRGLDRAVGIALAGWTATTDQWGPALLVDGDRYPDTSGSAFPDITSSIDAALALVERMLPGWDWALQKTGKVSTCWLNPPGTHLGRTIHAATAPIAILKALVAALIAQEKNHG